MFLEGKRAWLRVRGERGEAEGPRSGWQPMTGGIQNSPSVLSFSHRNLGRRALAPGTDKGRVCPARSGLQAPGST